MVFFAQQKPNDTQGAFAVEGIVQYLLEDNKYESFKKNYHFYIIPCVNPDGVKYGNCRTNAIGADLNKKWKNPHE
jgi:murein tripeptide amidase MpaA